MNEKLDDIKQILLSIIERSDLDLCSYYNKCTGDCENCFLENFDMKDFISKIRE
jgi:hypothetical protein